MLSPSAIRCSEMHSNAAPTLVCDLDRGHDGWHQDGEYGRWLPHYTGQHVGVVMPTKPEVQKFNAAVKDYCEDAHKIMGAFAIVRKRP